MKTLLVAFALWGSACGSGKPAPPLGAPLAVPADQWTWVDFPDAFCDDGSATGLGVYNSSASSNLLVFLNGGGACWDYLTCYQLNAAAHGPIDKTRFDA